VVCVLASAGGLEPLNAFFRQVPRETGMAFLVLQQHPVVQSSLLTGFVERHGAIRASLAREGDPVLPDQLLLLEAGMALGWEADRLRVARKPAQSHLLPGDILFESAAECVGERAVGVVLSGSGWDGTAGLRAILEQGGRTMVQSPATALHDSMPRHAVDAGVADWVLPARDLPGKILEGAAAPLLPNQEEAAAFLQAICAALVLKTGNDFSRYKPATLYRRIQRRMQVTGAATLQDYLACLEQSPEETGLLMKDLLISVTEFFRDPAAFEGLVAQLGPELLSGAAGLNPVRIWVPGCASGEEAYSLAILLVERLEALGSSRRVQIFATDIDSAALMQAKAGRYSDGALRNVSPERRNRFFIPDGAFHRVAKELRDLCLFSTQNILRDPPFSSLHLISCRNVFIYLQAELQRKLVPLFHFALRPGGLLFLGSSEGLASRTELFEPLDKASRIFVRREVHPRPILDFPAGGRNPQPSGRVRTAPEPAATASGLFERMLLEDYVPASAIVNELGDVLYCAGRIGRFLHPALGAPSGNLLQSTSGPLRRELRGLLSKAAGSPGSTAQGLMRHDSGQGEEILRISVRPMPGLERESGLFALVIQVEPGPVQAADLPGAGEAHPSLLDEMDLELRAARVELQTAVEDLEATNEELRASNEELQSSNEELQTSQEELQSVNQELTVTNNELHQKVRELFDANSDLQNLLTCTEIATLFLDPELRITRFTPSATELYGLIGGDLGRSILNLVPQFEGADLPALARAVLASHEPRETHAHSLDGQKWYIVRLLPYRNLARVVSGVVVTFVDFSGIRQAQQQVARSEEKFRGLFQNMVNGFAHCRMRYDGDRPADFLYLSVNSAFAVQTGLGDVVGKWVSEVIPGIREADPGLFEIYGRVARTGVPERFEIHVDALGDWFDISVYSPGLDEFVAVFDVVTPRKLAEAALRESEERLNLAMEKSHTGGWEFDLGDNAAYRTAEHARIFGYDSTNSDWSFDSFFNHVLPEDRENVGCRIREAIARQENWSLECRIRRVDGEIRWIALAGGPQRRVDGKPTRMAGIVQDITERKRAEQEIRSLEGQVNHLQRLESIGRLAGGVSHDMNNVLAAIMAVGSTLMVRHACDPVQLKEAQTLLSAATRGRDLVKGLRDFSRKELEAPAEVDLNVLARQEADLLDHTTLKKMVVQLDLEEGLSTVYGEASAISNALMNLCLNACDAMPDGGALRLTTRSLGQGFVELAVQDQGGGMDPEVRARAMEPFFTTKPAGQGTGLGLSLVYGTMKAHGGSVDIQSQPGQGTRVSLVFPPVVAVPAAPGRGAAPAPAGRSLSILLVDDEELIRRTVGPILQALGHQVETAAGGLEALKRVEDGLEPDLVMLDLNMPELDGSETFNRLRRIRPELPVVFATGYVDERIPSILSRFPKVRILKKPFTIAEIQEVLADWA
jgi:two-component system CheB/CheR fusion protein